MQLHFSVSVAGPDPELSWANNLLRDRREELEAIEPRDRVYFWEHESILHDGDSYFVDRDRSTFNIFDDIGEEIQEWIIQREGECFEVQQKLWIFFSGLLREVLLLGIRGDVPEDSNNQCTDYFQGLSES